MWLEYVRSQGVRWLTIVCCVGLAASVTTCGGGSEPSAPSAPSTGAASVIVTPSTMSIAVGARLPLQAEVQDASGQVLRGATVFWSSSDTTIATVSSVGVVSARAVGAVQIAASAGGRSAVATLAVVPVPVASVAVVPRNGTISVGATLALSAVTYDTVGAVLPGRQVVWASSAPQVARVDANGVVSGLTAGSAVVTATSEGHSGASTVTITAAATTPPPATPPPTTPPPTTPPPTTPPPTTPAPVAGVTLVPGSGSISIGQSTQVVATLRDAKGNVLSGRAISYTSSNSAVASVSATGLVNGITAGTVTITATSEGKSGTTSIIVTRPPPAAVASVSISLNSGSISTGQTTQATTVLKDAQGNVLTGRTISYNSSSTSVATVSGSGLVTAVGPGTSTITATSEGKSDTATITVTAPPAAAVASVSVSPNSGAIVVGSTLSLSATTVDASGATLTGRTVTWSSSDPQIASVSSSGVVTAVAAGSATITAMSEGKTGSAQITVTVPPVATVSVTPNTDTLQIGGTVALSATPRDGSGAALSGRAVTWSSDAPGVASVSADGVVTANSAGTATITATSEGKTGAATITVQPPAPVSVASVVITPAIATLRSNDSLVLTAEVLDASGNTLTGRTITWQGSSNRIAMVTPSGSTATVKAKGKAGSLTVTATSEGASGISTIFVIQ